MKPLQSWYLQYSSQLAVQPRDFSIVVTVSPLFQSILLYSHEHSTENGATAVTASPSFLVNLAMQSRDFNRELSYRRHDISVISVRLSM